jgi:hypothetical protein
MNSVLTTMLYPDHVGAVDVSARMVHRRTDYCIVVWRYQLLYSWVTVPTTAVQLGDHTNYCTVGWPYQLLYS